MKEHQRYFPVFKNGKLINKFCVVSNALTDDFSLVIEGNEKVLRPRLADGLFFYDNDLKNGLSITGLEKVAFFKGLGSVADKIQRETKIANTLFDTYKINASKDDLNRCRLVSSERGSFTRAFIEDFLEEQGLFYDDFDSTSEVDNPTAIIQSIKWSKPSAPITAVAFVSKIAIEYELKYDHLYESSINNTPIARKLYILYREDSEYIDRIKNIYEALQSLNIKT